MKRREGTVGDVGTDGWTSWTTVDDGASYNPSIGCGHFDIVVLHGTMWGASSDTQGILSIVEHDDDSIDASADYTFPWCLSGVLAAAAEVARMFEHPAPQNVVEAARELWFAMWQGAEVHDVA